ncbi:MAG: hypothetical protein M0Q93_00160 [Terrimicrobiaceae bacterium]|jgi:hypothetical protein|nr:hypothetical protein [Terrimicrobiaceae bacterium]
MPDVLPKAAKVAKPKKPSKLVKENAAVAKAVAAKETSTKKNPPADKPGKEAAPKPEKAKRPLIKLPYNLRTRSVVRTIIQAIEDPEARRTTNAALRDLRKYSEIKAWADENLGAEEFQGLLEDWFANGEVKS